MTLGFASWIDLLVIIIGSLAAITGIVLLIRMFRKPKELDESPPDQVQPVLSDVQIPQEKKPYIRINPNRSNTSPIPSEVSASEEPFAAPDGRKTVAVSHFEDTLMDIAPVPAPSLAKASISQVQPNLLRLVVLVDGDTLIYQKFMEGEWNELDVSYEPPIFRKEESYAPGTALNFHISGDGLEMKTYQFSILYQDRTGRAYRQEIGGMGTENPIIEGPVAIGNWQ